MSCSVRSSDTVDLVRCVHGWSRVHDQAHQGPGVVLSDWLDRMMMDSSEFQDLVNQDRAVWSPLYAISGALETSLVEVFTPDYGTRLDSARQRLLDADSGRVISDQ